MVLEVPTESRIYLETIDSVANRNGAFTLSEWQLLTDFYHQKFIFSPQITLKDRALFDLINGKITGQVCRTIYEILG